MSLKLVLPQIADQPDPDVELRAVYLEEWVEGLPYANPITLLGTLLDALQRFNRSPAKPALRFQLLEIYLQPYRYLLELQEKQGAIHTVAALERLRADTDATRKVAAELAYGYKIVLAESLGSRSLFGARSKHMMPALQRATQLLGFALLHSYSEYLPTPPRLWTELAQLYAYARENGLSTETPIPSPLGEQFDMSVEDAYKRILLTSLVDPHHLGYGEIWTIYELLGKWSRLAQLIPFAPIEKPAGMFVVHPDRDQRPVPYGMVNADRIPEGSWLLRAAPVIKAAQQRLFEAKSDDGAANGDDYRRRRERISLLGALIRALTLPPKRHSPREPSEGRVHVSSGISTVHHFLGGGEAPAPAQPAVPGEDEELEIGAPGVAENGDSLRHTYSAEYWDLRDRGPGGIGLIKHIRPNNPIGVGEVIGIQFDATRANGRWHVGVVRWLSIANAGEYAAGVQILANTGQAVAVSAQLGPGRKFDRRAAIALPELSEAAGSTLVAPTGIYQKDAAMTVDTPSGRVRIVADALVETASGYDRFSYRIKG